MAFWCLGDTSKDKKPEGFRPSRPGDLSEVSDAAGIREENSGGVPMRFAPGAASLVLLENKNEHGVLGFGNIMGWQN